MTLNIKKFILQILAILCSYSTAPASIRLLMIMSLSDFLSVFPYHSSSVVH